MEGPDAMDPEEKMALALHRAARDLTAERSIRDLDRTLALIVATALRTVPVADAGGIAASGDGGAWHHASDPAVTTLARLQEDLGEGPALEVPGDLPGDGLVVADDLAVVDADRWPRFAAAAVAAGHRSVLCARLHTGGSTRATLTLLASRPDAFAGGARVLAGLFATQAAMLLHGSEQARYLQRAVDSRDLIGQAKGILMERFRVDDDAAFQMLVRSSQDTNMKLADVARWLRSEVIGSAREPGADTAPAPG
ncbi:MAG TPA: GAF and ANTAR domain-containing protein [Actinomycetospora sp.]|uniref:GAF and ANTAR domain-containing protein n=1 Tax=Actinomycetospora sp. TaxID=1872135 RepID=UPI002F406DB2